MIQRQMTPEEEAQQREKFAYEMTQVMVMMREDMAHLTDGLKKDANGKNTLLDDVPHVIARVDAPRKAEIPKPADHGSLPHVQALAAVPTTVPLDKPEAISVSGLAAKDVDVPRGEIAKPEAVKRKNAHIENINLQTAGVPTNTVRLGSAPHLAKTSPIRTTSEIRRVSAVKAAVSLPNAQGTIAPPEITKTQSVRVNEVSVRETVVPVGEMAKPEAVNAPKITAGRTTVTAGNITKPEAVGTLDLTAQLMQIAAIAPAKPKPEAWTLPAQMQEFLRTAMPDMARQIKELSEQMGLGA